MKQQLLLGFLFSLSALMWGMLPLEIKQLLKSLDSQTIVWFRFLVVTLSVFAMFAFAKKLPNLTAFFRQYRWLWLVGCNFFLFNLALNYIPATISQVLSRFSSFVMIAFGVVLFKETIGIHQKIGFVLVVVGLAMFLIIILSELCEASDLNRLSHIGAITVVCGTMLSAVGHKLFYRNQLCEQQ